MREIETARLPLRTWREEALAPYARLCADPEVMRYLSGPMTREQSEQQASQFVRHWEERGFGLWAVEEKSSGAFIGFIGLLYHEDWSEGEYRTEVGCAWTALSGAGALPPRAQWQACATASRSSASIASSASRCLRISVQEESWRSWA